MKYFLDPYLTMEYSIPLVQKSLDGILYIMRDYRLTLLPPVTTFVTCSLVCLSSKVAYIANNMDPDQTAPGAGSSLIRAHSVCLHDKI